jgi:hypothetical protein
MGRGEDEQTGLGIEVARLARGYGIAMQAKDPVAPRVISGQAAFVRWLVCDIHVDWGLRADGDGFVGSI